MDWQTSRAGASLFDDRKLEQGKDSPSLIKPASPELSAMSVDSPRLTVTHSFPGYPVPVSSMFLVVHESDGPRRLLLTLDARTRADGSGHPNPFLDTR